MLLLLLLPPREWVLMGWRGCTAAGSKTGPTPSFFFKEACRDHPRNAMKATFKGQRNHLERRAGPAPTSPQRGRECHARARSLLTICVSSRPPLNPLPSPGCLSPRRSLLILVSECTFLQLTESAGAGPELGSVLCVQKWKGNECCFSSQV